MTNKIFMGVAVVALVLAGVGIYMASHPSQNLGAVTVTPYNGLNQQILVNELQNLANVNGSIVQSTTVITGLPSISSSTLLGTSTLVVGLPAAVGDTVLVSPVSTTTPGISWVGTVEVGSTSNATFRIAAVYASSTANPGTIAIPTPLTFNLTVLPFASFKAPTGL